MHSHSPRSPQDQNAGLERHQTAPLTTPGRPRASVPSGRRGLIIMEIQGCGAGPRQPSGIDPGELRTHTRCARLAPYRARGLASVPGAARLPQRTRCIVKSLTIKNIRCFTDPGPAPLAPLTLLVGENSTGKSTFLAATRLACQLSRGPGTPDFNEEPFLLGAFDQIANYRLGRAGRAESFSIGFDTDAQRRPHTHARSSLSEHIRLVCTFVNEDSQPFLSEWKVACGSYSLSILRRPHRNDQTLKLSTPSSSISIGGERLAGYPLHFLGERGYLEYLLQRTSNKGDTEFRHDGQAPSAKDQQWLSSIVRSIQTAFPMRPYASAPIRTEPRRTYEMLKDSPRPSGSHVPMILARTYGGSDWNEMKHAIERFGKASGLFDSLDVRLLGRHESGPFQVMIKVQGPPFNLVDVGYGVSQALPIVVDMIQGKSGSMFLLQQPEVHLHPRAQAELGSFLGYLIKNDKKSFVVETHSDYLVDRIRMDVRDGKSIRAKDVSILYFQREKSCVEIHPMTLDDEGNFEEIPDGYRWFFMDEETRFLGIK